MWAGPSLHCSRDTHPLRAAVALCGQGKKDTQEDRYIQGTRLGKIGTVFGVFDGHGGVHAAEYVSPHRPLQPLHTTLSGGCLL